MILRSPTLIAYNGAEAGLGNRIRVVLGAQSLAELEGRSFAYVWPTGPKFGPRFDQLWRFEAPVVPRAVSRVLARWAPYRDASLGWVTEETRRERLWQIRTGAELAVLPGATHWTDTYRALQPVPEIAERVRSVFDSELRGAPYVGVMVRAHAVSHQQTKDASPVAWFAERMATIAQQRPGTRFYLSCDVPEVAEQLAREVPGCVLQRDKGDYNTVEGVWSAVVDLYLLASAGHLVGPHYSSFLHLAQHLVTEPLPVETSRTAPVEQVDPAAAGLVEDPLQPMRRTAVGTAGA
jgi:hypothetical protein